MTDEFDDDISDEIDEYDIAFMEDEFATALDFEDDYAILESSDQGLIDTWFEAAQDYLYQRMEWNAIDTTNEARDAAFTETAAHLSEEEHYSAQIGWNEGWGEFVTSLEEEDDVE